MFLPNHLTFNTQLFGQRICSDVQTPNQTNAQSLVSLSSVCLRTRRAFELNERERVYVHESMGKSFHPLLIHKISKMSGLMLLLFSAMLSPAHREKVGCLCSYIVYIYINIYLLLFVSTIRSHCVCVPNFSNVACVPGLTKGRVLLFLLSLSQTHVHTLSLQGKQMITEGEEEEQQLNKITSIKISDFY